MEERAESLDTTLLRLLVFAFPSSSSFRWFPRRNQNAWDLHQLRTCKRDNAVWNYFRTRFQDNQVPVLFLIDVFGKIYCYISVRWIPERKSKHYR